MDLLGKALLTIDRHFHAPDDPQEFSERLFYNVGRLYTGGMLCGGISGLLHRTADRKKSQVLDAISDHAWHSSLTWAKAAFLYTPLEAALRKQRIAQAPLSQDVAWGAAWALARRRVSLQRRLALGFLVGAGHNALRAYGPLLAEGRQVAELWRWRVRSLSWAKELGHRIIRRDSSVQPVITQCPELTEALEPQTEPLFKQK